MAEADPAPKNPDASTAESRAKALLDDIWNDKSIGRAVRDRAKTMFPDIVTPDDQIDPVVAPLREALDATQAELKAMREERDAERAEALEASQRTTLEAALAGARQRYSLTDEGFDQMVARMKETGNYSDAEAAGAWVAQQTPVKTTTKADWLPKKMNFLGSGEINENEDFKLLHRNPDAYLDKQLEAFVADPEGYTRETLGA